MAMEAGLGFSSPSLQAVVGSCVQVDPAQWPSSPHRPPFSS